MDRKEYVKKMKSELNELIEEIKSDRTEQQKAKLRRMGALTKKFKESLNQ